MLIFDKVTWFITQVFLFLVKAFSWIVLKLVTYVPSEDSETHDVLLNGMHYWLDNFNKCLQNHMELGNFPT